MHQGGTALLLAAEGMIENARRLAARLLQADVDAIRYEAGMLRVAATGQEISLDEVARASYQLPGDDVAPAWRTRQPTSATATPSPTDACRRSRDRRCDR